MIQEEKIASKKDLEMGIRLGVFENSKEGPGVSRLRGKV